jgi:hypothetical protein
MQLHCKAKRSAAASKVFEIPRRWDREQAADALEERGLHRKAKSYRHCMHGGRVQDPCIRLDPFTICDHKFYQPIPCQGKACPRCYGYATVTAGRQCLEQLNAIAPGIQQRCRIAGEQYAVIVAECVRDLGAAEPVNSDVQRVIDDLVNWQEAIQRWLALRMGNHAMYRRVDVEADESGWRVVGRLLLAGPRLPLDTETLWRGEEPLVLRPVPDLASAVDVVFALRPAWTEAQAGVIEAALFDVRSTQGSGALRGAPQPPKAVECCPIHGNELVPGKLATVEDLRAGGYREVWEVVREAQQARASPAAAA